MKRIKEIEREKIMIEIGYEKIIKRNGEKIRKIEKGKSWEKRNKRRSVENGRKVGDIEEDGENIEKMIEEDEVDEMEKRRNEERKKKERLSIGKEWENGEKKILIKDGVKLLKMEDEEKRGNVENNICEKKEKIGWKGKDGGFRIWRKNGGKIIEIGWKDKEIIERKKIKKRKVEKGSKELKKMGKIGRKRIMRKIEIIGNGERGENDRIIEGEKEEIVMKWILDWRIGRNRIKNKKRIKRNEEERGKKEELRKMKLKNRILKRMKIEIRKEKILDGKEMKEIKREEKEDEGIEDLIKEEEIEKKEEKKSVGKEIELKKELIGEEKNGRKEKIIKKSLGRRKKVEKDCLKVKKEEDLMYWRLENIDKIKKNVEKEKGEKRRGKR